VCSPGFGYTAEGCIECGKNEVGSASGCACKSGYVRENPKAACEKAPTAEHRADGGTGESNAEAGVGGCSEDGDCTAGQACHPDTATCMSPPAGLGQSCASDADCAGTQAEHCDVFFTQTCQQKNCSLSSDNCFVGYECCDLSAFGFTETLCVPAGGCAP